MWDSLSIELLIICTFWVIIKYVFIKKVKVAVKLNKLKIIILAVAVLLLLTGCEDNNQEYRDMPNSLIEPMLKEWVSPDGVH